MTNRCFHQHQKLLMAHAYRHHVLLLSPYYGEEDWKRELDVHHQQQHHHHQQQQNADLCVPLEGKIPTMLQELKNEKEDQT